MIYILCFDRWSKTELFKKYYGKSKHVQVLYSYDPDEAIRMIKEKNPKFIILGGDVQEQGLKSVQLYYMMEELELNRKREFYISTWDTDEARTLKDMISDSFYCPFSKTLANIVKKKAQWHRNKIVEKERKERKNKPVSEKKDK